MTIELHHAALSDEASGGLKSTDLEAAPGERIVLTGPEGCGKLALLSLMTGVRAPSEGMVLFTDDGAEMTPRERKRKCFLIPPGGGLWDGLTVWENLMTVSRLYGMSKNAAELACLGAMEACGLTRAEDIPYGRLPPDWRARVSLCASAACGAETVGAVSPTAGLKEHESRRIAEMMDRIYDRRTTVIVCENDAFRAGSFGTRFLLLSEGRIVFDGTKEEMMRAVRRGNTAEAAQTFARRAGQ